MTHTQASAGIILTSTISSPPQREQKYSVNVMRPPSVREYADGDNASVYKARKTIIHQRAAFSLPRALRDRTEGSSIL